MIFFESVFGDFLIGRFGKRKRKEAMKYIGRKRKHGKKKTLEK